MKKMILILIVIFFNACQSNSKKENEENRIEIHLGYLIFNNSNVIDFVPLKELDSSNVWSSFRTANLGHGFQFNPDCKILNIIESSHLDTATWNVDIRPDLKIRYVLPVEIIYENNPLGKKSIAPNEKGDMKLEFRKVKESIYYSYDFRSVEVLKVTPLNLIVNQSKNKKL